VQRDNSGLICIKRVFGLILLVFGIYAGCISAQEKGHYGGGTGDPNDPYKIWTPEQFVAINAHSEDWGSCFRLMADVNLVDMDSELILPIGNHMVPFSGMFDGNHFAIENFVLESDSLNDVGIFGVVSTLAMKDRIDPDGLGRNYLFEYDKYNFDANEAVAHVKDLDIVNVRVRGKKNVGAVAARCYGSIQRCRVISANVVNAGTESKYISGEGSGVSGEGELIYIKFSGSLLSSASMVGHLVIGNLVDCHASSVVIDGVGMTGGIVGFSCDSKMSFVTLEGSVSGNYHTGGLAGDLRSTSVNQSTVDGIVSGGSNVGGLAGNASNSDLAECRVMGQVEGALDRMGGFVGSSRSSYIMNCYSMCDSNSFGRVRSAGGFIGDSSDDSISFCYSTGRLLYSDSLRLWPEGSLQLAGFIGNRDFSVCQNQATRGSFWDTEVSGVTAGVNHISMKFTDNCLPYEEIYGATTQEMWTRTTYEDVGWDFETIWAIEERVGYPVLQWELSSAPEGQ